MSSSGLTPREISASASEAATGDQTFDEAAAGILRLLDAARESVEAFRSQWFQQLGNDEHLNEALRHIAGMAPRRLQGGSFLINTPNGVPRYHGFYVKYGALPSTEPTVGRLQVPKEETAAVYLGESSKSSYKLKKAGAADDAPSTGASSSKKRRTSPPSALEASSSSSTNSGGCTIPTRHRSPRPDPYKPVYNYGLPLPRPSSRALTRTHSVIGVDCGTHWELHQPWTDPMYEALGNFFPEAEHSVVDPQAEFIAALARERATAHRAEMEAARAPPRRSAEEAREIKRPAFEEEARFQETARAAAAAANAALVYPGSSADIRALETSRADYSLSEIMSTTTFPSAATGLSSPPRSPKRARADDEDEEEAARPATRARSTSPPAVPTRRSASLPSRIRRTPVSHVSKVETKKSSAA